MNDGAPILSLNGVSSGYGAVRVLHDVSAQVKKGGVCSILGRNGVGKTTLIRTILGILRCTKGSVSYDGQDITRLTPFQRARSGIGWVPEGREVFSTLSVRENLLLGAFGCRSRRVVQERLDRNLALFPRLSERLKQVAGSLSGGEQQMLAIGRAMMSDPTVLVMDEPSLGLAPIIVSDVFRYVREINKSGVTVLMVEQNATQALAVSTYAYVLNAGTVVASGTPEDITRDGVIRDAFLGTGAA